MHLPWDIIRRVGVVQGPSREVEVLCGVDNLV